MAKKKIGKGAGAQDTDEMTKSELKAYHKEICEFYEEHGWRTTLSHYSLSPGQAKGITEKTRAKLDKAKEKEKASKKKGKAAKAKTKEKAKAPKKKKAPPKPSKLKGKAEKKAAKAKKAPKKEKAKARKKPGPKKGSKRKAAASTGEGLEGTLDYLLAYRNGRGGEAVSLDTVIADLATQVRAA